MSGRGDNNKSGSSGRGASNQSNQGFAHGEKKTGGEKTGTQRSQPQDKKQSQSANRNSGTDGGNNSR